MSITEKRKYQPSKKVATRLKINQERRLLIKRSPQPRLLDRNRYAEEG